MTDRPILFSSAMVRALLDGRKTQTRRVIKPRGMACLFDGSWTDDYVMDPGNASWRERFYPYRVGDRLWVRETATRYFDDTPPVYRADYDDLPLPDGVVWKPSIFMRRADSRLTLTVTDVRVERLQEISSGDAMAEGVESTEYWRPKDLDSRPFEEKWWDDATFWAEYPPQTYRALWDALNHKRGYGWETAPWVCALTFAVQRGNIDQVAP